ncbi:hypothetical protein GCM10027262_51820 [Nocardia tengchongensis]
MSLTAINFGVTRFRLSVHDRPGSNHPGLHQIPMRGQPLPMRGTSRPHRTQRIRAAAPKPAATVRVPDGSRRHDATAT